MDKNTCIVIIEGFEMFLILGIIICAGIFNWWLLILLMFVSSDKIWERIK